MKSRLVLAAAAATATLLAACGGPASTAGGPPAPPSFFGVNGDVLYQYALHGQADTLAAQLDAIGGGGLAFVRSPANWSQIEPSPAAGRTGFDFTISDAFVGALASHELSWQPIGQGLPIPQWAAEPKVYSVCGFRSAPARPQFLAIYLAAIAKRYGRGGSFWSAHPELPYMPVTTYEVGNEPNHYAFWCPRPDPPAYALTFIASAQAIHAIDPKATVELGGLAAFPDSADPLRLSPQAFLSAALAAQPRLKDEIDAVAFHPYATTPAAVVSNLIAFRKVVSADGLGRVPSASTRSAGRPSTGRACPRRPRRTGRDTWRRSPRRSPGGGGRSTCWRSPLRLDDRRAQPGRRQPVVRNRRSPDGRSVPVGHRLPRRRGGEHRLNQITGVRSAIAARTVTATSTASTVAHAGTESSERSARLGPRSDSALSDSQT